MSITHVTERETALQKSFDRVVNAAHLALETGCKAIEERDALREELASTKRQEPVSIPDDVRTVAKSMQKDGYRGPLAWATKVIDFVADYTHPPTAPVQAQERKPLPREDLRIIFNKTTSSGFAWYEEFARSIERAHGITEQP